jgi:hypothetical protein
MALMVLSGLYLILVAIVAFGIGGYIAGRMRAPIRAAAEEIEFRDGVQGLLVWAIALILTVLMTWATAQSLTRLSAPSGGPSGSAQSVAGENIVAFDLDRLFRSDRPQTADLSYARSQAARILLTTAGHSGISSDDRSYLVRLTSQITGLAPPQAETRTDAIIVQARDNIRRARRAAVILAFMAGAAALLGVAVAWFAACAGGRHRDNDSAPSMVWSWNGPRVVR